MAEFYNNTNLYEHRLYECSLYPYRDQNVEQVFQDGKLGDQLLHYFAEGFEYAVVVDRRLVEAQMNLVVACVREKNCYYFATKSVEWISKRLRGVT